MKILALILAAVPGALAGPVEFGTAQLQRAIEERGLNPRRVRFKTAITTDDPDSFRVAPGLITGGSLRGLMFGLLEAADQIRASGRVRLTAGTPALAVRGARVAVDTVAPAQWQPFVEKLARNRFNRVTVAIGEAADLDTVRTMSEVVQEYGLEFTLGLADKTPAEAALRTLLAKSPGIRAVQVAPVNGVPPEVVAAIRDAGHWMTLEIAGEKPFGSLGVPHRIVLPYFADGNSPALPEVHWRISHADAPDAGSAARVIPGLLGSAGFEVEIRADAGDEFLHSWGRLAYDGHAPEAGGPKPGVRSPRSRTRRN